MFFFLLIKKNALADLEKDPIETMSRTIDFYY